MSSLDVFVILLLLLFFIIAAEFLVSMLVIPPYVPTPKRVVDAMIDLAELKGDETVYDLGAGDARFLIRAKKRYPNVVAKGCEFIPTVWILGKWRIWRSGQKVSLHLRSFQKLDVTDADVVFLYMSMNAMRALEKKFDKELKPGTIVISHAFRFDGHTPVSEHTLHVRRERKLFLYRW